MDFDGDDIRAADEDGRRHGVVGLGVFVVHARRVEVVGGIGVEPGSAGDFGAIDIDGGGIVVADVERGGGDLAGIGDGESFAEIRGRVARVRGAAADGRDFIAVAVAEFRRAARPSRVVGDCSLGIDYDFVSR